MKFNATQIPYHATGLFSPLVRDYINGKGTASDFVNYVPSIDGIEKATSARNNFKVNRSLLVEVLKAQYATIPSTKAVNENVESLLKENTYVITTAHQPNIFTGPLYFFYKIIHAIQLAADLKKQFPQNNYVPVYYMGSEDADIEEVGSFYLGGDKLQWSTKQSGAIGRMKVDDALIGLLKNMEGYWSVKPQGKEALNALVDAYKKGVTINEATLSLVHSYFGQYGLVVIQPDDAKLKASFIPVMEKELLTQFSHKALQPTLEKLRLQYHVQTEGRAINLFYLKDNLRARIELNDGVYAIVDTDITFTSAEIIAELHAHPERFSPNVILRGVYQETILPGIAFIGGGGELAYWMELKDVFKEANVHYPLLQLRNSFLFINAKMAKQWNELGFELTDLFKTTSDLEVAYVKANAQHNLSLEASIEAMKTLYSQIQKQAIEVDATLGDHTMNLSVQSIKKLAELEKKILKAEKKKQAVAIERVQHIKMHLFPENSLQERVDNFAEWVGEYGWDWVEAVLQNSNSLDHAFTILVAKD
ncbi:MAG: bacillithiol biosynthesis cysteine-adding enzyme BshC [Bacteroidota bacterium]